VKLVRTVIIAKAPVAGFAKTRLIPALGAQGAAKLAQRMLLHTVATALAAEVGPVELCVTPDPSDPIWHHLDLPEGFAWSAQGTGDLGKRMAQAAKRTIDNDEAVILIGTDCPAITASTLHDAAEALRDHDAVMVPTADGGYALLGLRRFQALLFDGIPWSTNVVAAQTLDRIRQLGWRVKAQATLHDIDEPVDLQWLPTAWVNA